MAVAAPGAQAWKETISGEVKRSCLPRESKSKCLRLLKGAFIRVVFQPCCVVRLCCKPSQAISTRAWPPTLRTHTSIRLHVVTLPRACRVSLVLGKMPCCAN